MKNIACFICLALVLHVSLCKAQQQSKPTQPSEIWKTALIYDVYEKSYVEDASMNNMIIPHMALNMTYNGYKTANATDLIHTLNTEISKGKRPLYNCNIFGRFPLRGTAPEPHFSKGYSDSALMSYIALVDSNGNPITLVRSIEDKEIVAVNLYQEWAYNDVTHKFSVCLPDLALASHVMNADGEIIPGGMKYCGMYEFSKRSCDSVSNPGTRLGDPGVVWSNAFDVLLKPGEKGSGTVITGNLKYDSTLLMRFSPPADEECTYSYVYPLKNMYALTLAQRLYQEAVSGKLQCAAYNLSDPAKPGAILTSKEVKQAASFSVKLVDETGAEKTIAQLYGIGVVKGIEVYQELEFNPQTFTFTATIKRAAIIVQGYDDSGMVMPGKNKMLFWVLFK